MNNVTLGGIVKTNNGKPCYKLTFDNVELAQEHKKQTQQRLIKQGFKVTLETAYYDQKAVGGA